MAHQSDCQIHGASVLFASRGQLKQYTGLQCSDNYKFELALYVVGSSPSRNYLFCPCCYNNPERQWGKMPSDPTGKNFCLECPLPDYHPVIKSLTVCDDPESGGVFILDVASKPSGNLFLLVLPLL